MSREAMLEFLTLKIKDARKQLAARESMAATWREGTPKEWDEVSMAMGGGKAPSKQERERRAALDDRIAEKYRKEIEALEAIVVVVRS